MSSSRSRFEKSLAREYLESLVVALILALFIRTFLIQAFKIPTGSMETNLLIGDHLLVNKQVYSPSFGALEDSLLGKRRVARGHVVVFKYPEDPTKDFIKRVIGLPGESVEVRGRTVLIDGHPLDEPYAHFLDSPLSPHDPEFGFSAQDGRESWGPSTVPAGKVFVMGDNRDNSRDSRFWGYLGIDQIKGRAWLVYWSYAATRDEYREGGLDRLKSSFSALPRTRWDRFFHVIR